MQQPNDDRYEFILECLIGLSCLVLFSILWSNKGVISSAVDNVTGGNTKQTTADTGQPVTGKEKAILPLPKMKPPGGKSSYGWRINPVTGNKQFHTGHDIGATQGTPILSILPGKVTAAGYIGACGNTVKVKSGELEAVYCHIMNGGILVKEGENVKQGQVIAKVGSTGRSTGPHLHIGIKRNGAWIPPLEILPKWY